MRDQVGLPPPPRTWLLLLLVFVLWAVSVGGSLLLAHIAEVHTHHSRVLRANEGAADLAVLAPVAKQPRPAAVGVHDELLALAAGGADDAHRREEELRGERAEIARVDVDRAAAVAGVEHGSKVGAIGPSVNFTRAPVPNMGEALPQTDAIGSDRTHAPADPPHAPRFFSARNTREFKRGQNAYPRPEGELPIRMAKGRPAGGRSRSGRIYGWEPSWRGRVR